MIYIISGLSILFFVLSFVLTENNAKYILSGYNTMSEEERKKVDLKSVIQSYKSFHIFLAISFFVLGILIYKFMGEAATAMFLGIYPILAYTVFVFRSKDSLINANPKTKNLVIGVLLATLVFLVYLFMSGNKENLIILHDDSIEITESYGETIKPEEIQSIQLVESLPKIKLKSNGYATGEIRKGYFKTDKGEKIKLIVNQKSTSYILITKTDEKKIYYASKSRTNTEVLNEIKKRFPELVR